MIPIAPVIPAAIDLDPVVGIDGNSTVIAAAFLKDGAASRTAFHRGSEAGNVKLPLAMSTVMLDFTVLNVAVFDDPAFPVIRYPFNWITHGVPPSRW